MRFNKLLILVILVSILIGCTNFLAPDQESNSYDIHIGQVWYGTSSNYVEQWTFYEDSIVVKTDYFTLKDTTYHYSIKNILRVEQKDMEYSYNYQNDDGKWRYLSGSTCENEYRTYVTQFSNKLYKDNISVMDNSELLEFWFPENIADSGQLFVGLFDLYLYQNGMYVDPCYAVGLTEEPKVQIDYTGYNNPWMIEY